MISSHASQCLVLNILKHPHVYHEIVARKNKDPENDKVIVLPGNRILLATKHRYSDKVRRVRFLETKESLDADKEGEVW